MERRQAASGSAIRGRHGRASAIAAGLAIVLLVAVSATVLTAIEEHYRRNVSTHLLSRLDTIYQLLDLMNGDAMTRVRTIAEEPRLKTLTEALVRAPGEAKLSAELAEWITPLYHSRGFEGYALIAPESLLIVASGSPAYVGKPVSLQTTREAIERSQHAVAAMGRPGPSLRPVVTFGVEVEAGVPYQNVCARIDGERRILGYLCLRENPGVRLYRVLQAARPGVTGESYVIDSEARILSPIRFEGELETPPGRSPGWSSFNVFARPPLRSVDADRAVAARDASSPPTRVAAAILRNGGASGFLEDYRDYRGRRVVGAARWLTDVRMGIVVEQDMNEAYRSFYVARLALGGLVGVAALLIVALTVVQWRSRRSLARSEQQLTAFRDHIPAALHMKDRAGRYLMANPEFEKMVRIPAKDLLGRTDMELLPAALAQASQAEHEEVVRSGTAFVKTDTIRDAVYSTVRFPILGEDALTVTGVGTALADVTAQVKARRELEELSRTLEKRVAERTKELAAARDQAQAASEAKARFLATMSHEIRTPLNAVIGMSYLASQANASPRVARYLQRIQSSGQHLLGIVNDILDLSRIEAGKLSIDAVEFSVERTLEHVVGLISEPARAKGLALDVEVEPGLPPRLLGDPVRISQILINFANNAVKFTGSGRIVLRAKGLERSGDVLCLRFEVQDSGIGIAEDKLPLLFAPFQQLDSTTSRRYGGTGLGLAISRSLAELMGAEVSVTSRVGQGSIFSLEIPLRVAADVQRNAAIAELCPPGAGHLDGCHVLLVDDNEVNQELVHELLQAAGVRVSSASDGAEALRMIDEGGFDAILMDVHMPGMNGFETTAAIRERAHGGRVPIIALTANAARGDRERCLAAGMDDYVPKPIEPQQLFGVLARHCAGRFDRERSPAPALQNASSDERRTFDALSGIAALDTAQALDRTMGRVDLYTKLARRIATERSDLPERLQSAIDAGDAHEVAEILHGAKSILGALGATRLQHVCEEAERRLEAGEPLESSVGQLAADLSALLGEVRRVTTS